MISPNYVELHYPAHTILPVEMSIDLSKLREYVYEEKVSSLRHIGINPVAICYLICFVYIVVSQEIAISSAGEISVVAQLEKIAATRQPLFGPTF